MKNCTKISAENTQDALEFIFPICLPNLSA